MEIFTSTIRGIKKLSPFYFEIVFSWPPEKEVPEPGQFLTFKADETTAPLLRRPFAVSDFNKEDNTVSAIIQIRGQGTAIIAEKEVEQTVELLGPLGNSFNRETGTRTPVLIAGGVGLGPILFLYNTMLKENKKPLLVTGFRNSSMVASCLPEEEPGNVVLCTDDGSAGYKGNVVDYLYTLDPALLENSEIFACGPTPMMKACHMLALRKEFPCQVSMEEMMACSVGACMGCVIPASEEGKYYRVCKEGPVFNSRRLKWI